MIKKFVCKICKKTISDNLQVMPVCNSCVQFRNYKEHYPVPHKPIDVLPWLHFDFEPRGLSNAYNTRGLDVMGSCQFDDKTGITHVRIDLYRFKNHSDLTELIRVIVHEFNHYAIQETYPFDNTMSKWDNLNYRELEKWLSE